MLCSSTEEEHRMEDSTIWPIDDKFENDTSSMLPQMPTSVGRLDDVEHSMTQSFPGHVGIISPPSLGNGIDIDASNVTSDASGMLHREEFVRLRREWEMANRENERLNSEWRRLQFELEEANRQKEQTLLENKRLREENHDLVVERVKLTNEKARLMQEVHLLRTGSKTATEESVNAPTREQMPFDLKWDCKSCSKTNRRLISACEFCGESNQLPMYIDGFEVTTPKELKARKTKDKKPFVLLNPKKGM